MNIHIIILKGLHEELYKKYPQFTYQLHHYAGISPYIDVSHHSGQILRCVCVIIACETYIRFGRTNGIEIDYNDPEFVEKVIKTFAAIICS